MKIILIVLFIVVVICVILPYLCLRYTRNKADLIIVLKKPASSARMNKYIRVLTVSSILLFGLQSERDRYRIDRLRDIRNALDSRHRPQ